MKKSLIAIAILLAWATLGWAQTTQTGAGHSSSASRNRPWADIWTEDLWIFGNVQVGDGVGTDTLLIYGGSTTTGLTTIGSGTGGLATGAGDLFISGDLEVDTTARFDGILDSNSTMTTYLLTFDSPTVDGTRNFLTFRSMDGAVTKPASPSANSTQLYSRSKTLFFQDEDGLETNLLAAGAGNTLDQAYDQGGVGVGRTITASDGAVTINSTDSDAAYLFAVTPTPGGAAALGGISIVSGANSTQDALNISNAGTGFDIAGTSDLFTVAKTGAAVAASLTSTSLDFAGALSLGTVNATSIALSKTGVTTTSAGPLTVSEVFTANGNVDLGNALADTVSIIGSIDQNVTIDDGLADSPSFIFTDATNETMIMYKEDNLDFVMAFPVASSDSVRVNNGNIRIGTTAPSGLVLNGGDFVVSDDAEIVDRLYAYGNTYIGNTGADTLIVEATSAFNEDILQTLGAVDEEMTVTTAIDAWVADSALVTISDTYNADALDNAMYMLRLRYTRNADTNADFVVMEDNAGDDMFSVASDGAATSAAGISGTIFTALTTVNEGSKFSRNQAITTVPVLELETTHVDDDSAAFLIDHNATGAVDAADVENAGTGYALHLTGEAAGSGGLHFDVANSATARQIYMDLGPWLGTSGQGAIEVVSDAAAIIPAGYLAFLDQNGTGVHAAAIAGSALRVEDAAGAPGAGTSYAAYIAATSIEALHVDTGVVQIDETLTVGTEGGGLVVNELVDINLDDSAEAVTINTTSDAYAANAGLLTITDDYVATAYDNAMYGLVISYARDDDPNGHGLAFLDNGGTEPIFSVEAGGAIYSYLNADKKILVDATISHTDTAGAIDLDYASATGNSSGLNVNSNYLAGGGANPIRSIHVNLDDDSDAAGEHIGLGVTATDVVGSSSVIGVKLEQIDQGILVVLPAASQAIAIDAASTVNTNTDGVSALDYSTVTNGGKGGLIEIHVGDAGAGVTATAFYIDLDDDTATNAATIDGVHVVGSDIAGHAATVNTAFKATTVDIAFQAVNGSVLVGSGAPDVAASDNDLYVTGTFEVDAASRFDEALDINEELDIDLNANDEEVSIDASATDYAANSGILSVRGTGAPGQTNNTWLIQGDHNADGDAQDNFIRFRDNAYADVKFSVNSGGVVYVDGGSNPMSFEGDTADANDMNLSIAAGLSANRTFTFGDVDFNTASVANANLAAPNAYYVMSFTPDDIAATQADIVMFQMPFAATLVEASVTIRDIDTVDASETYTVDVQEAGVSVLAAVMTVAADGTPVVGTVSDSTIADNALMTIDFTLGGVTPSTNDATVVLTFKRAHVN